MDTVKEDVVTTGVAANAAEWLKLTVMELVDHPLDVRVTELVGAQVEVLTIHVAAEDVRRVLGRKGRTVDALRLLLASMGGKHGRRYILEVAEPPR